MNATHPANPLYPDTDRYAAQVLAAGPGAEPLVATVRVPRPWGSPPDELVLSVRYQCTGSPDAPSLGATVAGTRFRLDDPVQLIPVVIPKPWGREVWYTGIEARGESRVAGSGGELGLGSYLALAPERLCRRQPLVLLKILDPRPDPVLGELYLEVHQVKREVYVVTAVDPAAWPDGRGRIRYGANQSLRTELGSDDAFRQAFLQAVHRYEVVRRAIDDGATGLEAEEQSARAAARAFTSERTLVPGDVISVPTWLPHSLQQGVRVVEFQTPTYERLIVSSTQRVLTQSGWDSVRAIEGMTLDVPPDPEPEPVAAGVDRVVAFADFSVWRAQLERARELRLPDGLPYVVAYCISGRFRLPGRCEALTLAPGHAAFVPASALDRPITTQDKGILLVAAPGL